MQDIQHTASGAHAPRAPRDARGMTRVFTEFPKDPVYLDDYFAGLTEEQVQALANRYTLATLAEYTDVSRQAIHAYFSRRGIKADARWRNLPQHVRDAAAWLIDHLHELTLVEAARQTGLAINTVRSIRAKFGLTSKDPFPHAGQERCPRCDTEPYARGLCRNCYQRHLYRRAKARKNNPA